MAPLVIPSALTDPEPVPSLEVQTARALAAAAVRTRASLLNANEKLGAIRCLADAHAEQIETACDMKE